MSTSKQLFTQSQKDILSLYRKGLRLLRSKPQQNQYHFTLYLRYMFKHPTMGGGLKRKDFNSIEYMVRRVSKLYEQVYQQSNVKDIQMSLKVKDDMKTLQFDGWWKNKIKN